MVRYKGAGMLTLVCAACGAPFPSTHRRRRYCSRQCSNMLTGRTLEARASSDHGRVVVWSCGGGVDSTALAVLICQGELPKPDYAIMVDVGYEPETTWTHARTVLSPRLAAVGVTLTILRTRDYTDNELVKNGHLVIPAHRRNADGTTTKLHTHCSGPWKARVAKRWLRAQGVEACEHWIGISADEKRRARPDPHKWVKIRWPLIERGMTRTDCVYLLGTAGWPLPDRTSCWMCPQRSIGDWRQLVVRSPADFAQAIQTERAIQAQFPNVYLHHSCEPLDVAVNGCRQPRGQEGVGRCQSAFSACM